MAQPRPFRRDRSASHAPHPDGRGPPPPRRRRRPDPALHSELDEGIELPSRPEELIALDEALTRLGELDERQARVVELKFFAGMELDEIAQALGIGSATVTRDWRLARGWLFQTLNTS